MKKIVVGLLLLCIAHLLAKVPGGLTMKQTIGARPFGMGEAFVGIADDVNAIQFNPGGLTGLKETQLSAMAFKTFLDMYYASLNYAEKISETEALGFTFTTFQGGKIKVNWSAGGSTEKNAKVDVLAGIVYATELPELEGLYIPTGKLPGLLYAPLEEKLSFSLRRVSIGVGLKILHSILVETEKATTLALDVGGLLKLSDRLALGLAFQNLGPPIRYKGKIATGDKSDIPPIGLRAGFGWHAVTRERTLYHDIIIGGEIDMFIGIKTIRLAGLEYTYRNILSFRLGYKMGHSLASSTFGVGLKIKGLYLDYAIGLMSKIDHFHKATIIIIM